MTKIKVAKAVSTQTNHPIGHNHHRSKDSITRNKLRALMTCKHHGDDQRHLNNGHANRQNQHAIGLPRFMGDHFCMMHGSENGANQNHPQ